MTTSREQQDQESKAYSRVVAKAWGDPAFKQQLLANPTAVLKSEGVSVPEGTEVRIMENTDKVVHLPLPVKPTQLSDEQLDQVAGGGEDCIVPLTVTSVIPLCG